MELQTPSRQLSQAVLLQHEAMLTREAFNQQFEVVQASKRELIAATEEKLVRISSIEQELGTELQATATAAALVSLLLYSPCLTERDIPVLLFLFWPCPMLSACCCCGTAIRISLPPYCAWCICPHCKSVCCVQLIAH